MTAIELRTLVDSKTQFFASLDIFRRYEPHIGLVPHAHHTRSLRKRLVEKDWFDRGGEFW